MSEQEIQKQEMEAQTNRFLSIIMVAKKGWKFISIAMLIVTGLTAAYIFSIPRTYKTEAILLPETSNSIGLSGNLGDLASLAGIKMNGASTEDAIYPEFYPKVLGSSIFVTELLKDSIYCKRLEKKVSVFDYFYKYQKTAWWSKSKKIETNKNISAINPICPTKEQDKVMSALSKSLFCSVDRKNDMITIQVTAQDPEVVQQLTEKTCHRLQQYITNYRTNKARKDLNYMKKITSEAHDKYIKAQGKYASYCDTNEDVMLASFQQVRDRLENEMQMAYNTYSQYAQQMQLAQVKLQEKTPVYTTIQPATIPLKPSGPKRMFAVLAALLLSSFGSLTWLLTKGCIIKK